MTSHTGNKNKLIIIDDHPIVAYGISQLLEDEGEIEICGSATDANSALTLIDKHDPDMAVIDISLKGSVNGIDLTKALKNRYPHLKILILSMHESEFYAERALRAGARGYLMKSEMTSNLIEAIKKILSGELYLNPKTSVSIVETVIYNTGRSKDDPIKRLSDREFEVFQLLGKGLNSKDIGQRLSVSPKTIETYKYRLKNKLKCKTASELSEYAHSFNSDKNR